MRGRTCRRHVAFRVEVGKASQCRERQKSALRDEDEWYVDVRAYVARLEGAQWVRIRGDEAERSRGGWKERTALSSSANSPYVPTSHQGTAMNARAQGQRERASWDVPATSRCDSERGGRSPRVCASVQTL